MTISAAGDSFAAIQFIAGGVVDTGEQFIAGVNDTGVVVGVVDTGQK